jgi:TPR repeat protein
MKLVNRVLALYFILGFISVFFTLQVRAESNIGNIYENFLVTKSKAEQGDAGAQSFLGIMYLKGIGLRVPQDNMKAVHWFTKAAKQGNADAQFSLGAKFYDGEGVPQDYKKALHWLTKAAEQGDVTAQRVLGIMHYDGEGVPENYKKALHWFTKAAEQGDAGAQSFLGIIYYNGEGVPQDFVKAYVLFNLAAFQGNATSKHNREILLKQMSSSQIEEGQKLSKNPKKRYLTKTRGTDS